MWVPKAASRRRGLKQSAPEVDHSSQSSAEVKNEWSSTSVPPIFLHGMEKDFFFLTLPSLGISTVVDKLLKDKDLRR